MPTTPIVINTQRIQKITDLTIASGGTVSNYLDADKLAEFDRIVITAPSTITNTVKVKVGYDTADDSVLVFLQDPPGTDITLAVNKSVILPINLPAVSLAAVSSGAEAQDDVFHVFGHVRAGID